MKQVFVEAIKSLKLMKQNSPLIIFSSILDVIFLIVYGFLTAPLFFSIVENITSVGTKLSQLAPEFSRTFTVNPGIINLLFTHPSLKPHTNTLIASYLILVLVIFVLYNLFQGINWRLARQITGDNTEWGSYLGRFAKINVFWIFLFVIYHILDVIASLQQTIAEGVVNTRPTNTLGIISIIFLVTIIYFAFISYNSLSIKKSFKEGIKKAKNFVPMYLVIAAVFVIIQYLLVLVQKLGTATTFIVGVALLLPALSWTRIYITKVSQL